MRVSSTSANIWGLLQQTEGSSMPTHEHATHQQPWLTLFWRQRRTTFLHSSKVGGPKACCSLPRRLFSSASCLASSASVRCFWRSNSSPARAFATAWRCHSSSRRRSSSRNRWGVEKDTWLRVVHGVWFGSDSTELVMYECIRQRQTTYKDCSACVHNSCVQSELVRCIGITELRPITLQQNIFTWLNLF